MFETDIYGSETKRYKISAAKNEPETIRFEKGLLKNVHNMAVTEDETEMKRYKIGVYNYKIGPI